MLNHAFDITTPGLNPLDLFEELISGNDWPCERISESELQATIKGRWSEYHMYFIWQEEFSALQFFCQINLQMPEIGKGVQETPKALKGVNENMWLGHFDICKEDMKPTFRYNLLMRGTLAPPSVEQIEDLLDIAVAECDRFYPCFQMLSTSVISAEQALTSALLEPVGEA